jgi:hypothetical protein
MSAFDRIICLSKCFAGNHLYILISFVLSDASEIHHKNRYVPFMVHGIV